MSKDKVRVTDLAQMKAERTPIAMLTAYDFPFARIFDAAGVDVLLVGDSLGMVVQGADSTLAVTLDEVIYHTRMVTRARQRALVVADLPFLTYQVSVEKALAWNDLPATKEITDARIKSTDSLSFIVEGVAN